MFKGLHLLENREEHLVKGCLKGDTQCQKGLYDDYRQQMFRMCLRYARTREEAEDYLQEGFTKVFKDLYQFKSEGPLGAWIRKVIVNVILQEIRKRKHLFPPVDIDKVTDHLGEEELITSGMDAKLLTEHIQKLPDGYRTVFNMYVVEGFSHKEIARELNINIGTSKSQLAKARARLRARIEKLMRTNVDH